jgi:hypothetical protein
VVLAQSRDLDRAGAAEAVAIEFALESGPIVGSEQAGDVRPPDLLRAIAEQLLGGRIEGLDGAAAVGGDEAGVGVVDDGADLRSRRANRKAAVRTARSTWACTGSSPVRIWTFQPAEGIGRTSFRNSRVWVRRVPSSRRRTSRAAGAISSVAVTGSTGSGRSL